MLAHAVGLFAFLLVLRWEKASAFGIRAGGPIAWAGFVLPDLSFVLLVAALWLLLGPGRWRRAGLAATHVALALLAVVAHVFLLATGYRLDIQLLVYAARHFAMLRQIFSLSIDWRTVARLVGALVCALGPLALPRRAGGRARERVSGRAAGLGALLAGLVLGFVPSRAPFAANDVGAFFGSARMLVRERLASRYAVEPNDYYRPPTPTGEPARRTSVILVILESTGAGAAAPWTVGAATPSLERLARGGLTVENAYASVTHTSKALVGLLCGVMPRLDMEIVEAREGNLPLACLPGLLSRLGYRTAFLQTALSRFENRPGLVRNLGYDRGAYLETLRRPPFEQLGYLGLDDRAMLEPALGWIDAVGEAPYFITLLTSVPHHPYQTAGSTEAEALADPRAAYERAIAAQDRFLAELVAGLEQDAALERAVLIVVGDHGEAFGEHHRRQHDAVPYEEVVRVPWVLYSPSLLGPPRAIGGLRHHVDLLPTVLGLLGVPWEGELPGEDLLSSGGQELVVSSCWYTATCVAARTGETKVVYHFGRRPLEVFDLASDPLEGRNLANALPEETLREVEDRLLGYKLSVDRFWEQHPVRRGPTDWWVRAPGSQGSGGG